MKLQLSLIEAFYAEQEFAVFSVVDTAADTGAVKYVAAKDSSTFMCLVEPPVWVRAVCIRQSAGGIG